MNEQDIVNNVISSGILDEYQNHDDCLKNVVDTISINLKKWESINEISISKNLTSAKNILDVFIHRLIINIDEPRFSEEDRIRNIAIEQLIVYCKEHIDSGITTMLINCPQHSYIIYCGILNDQINIICLIVGKHIPKYALK